MDITGEIFIPLTRNVVWAALNDADILKASIQGCETLDWTSETTLEATVSAKIGPVKAKFRGNIELLNVRPLEGYTLTGQGKGGAAGFAKGSADVKLKDQDGGTFLTYEAKAGVGGKLAQIGSRLIDSTARKYADDFFSQFSQLAAEKTPAGPEAPVEEPSPPTETDAVATPEDEEGRGGLHPAIWAIFLIALVLISLYIFGG